ncbi:DNA methylase [SAR116 cluster alpha proteobacterium HIMB100]|nr:DNA methylase [SAR116 cluster alpha proteobacterium HIMB100]
MLDPFCGCGTAVDAAQALGRRWAGMDVSVLAINAIRARLEDVHGTNVMTDVEVTGIPTSLEAARMLFQRDPFEFERWAVDLVGAEPNKKQVGDSGSDGELTFPSTDKKRAQRGVVSGKGGANVNPAMVRDLRGTVEAMNAAMGVLVLMKSSTRGMVTEAAKAGLWTDDFTDRNWPKLQIITVAELLDGRQPDMPNPRNPYTKATHTHSDSRQEELL